MLTSRRPSLRSRGALTAQGALSIGIFAVIVLYAAVVSGACGCYSCMSGLACAFRSEPYVGGIDVTADPTPEDDVPFAEFRINNRWTSTSYNSSTSSRGTPITLSWGIVADGTSIPGDGGAPSSLIAMLNGQYGAGPGGIQNAPWFRLFQDSFNRWSEVAGITYVYEPNDGGAAIDGSTTPAGQRGVYADVRIGGHSIDGSTGGNTLAYNYFPNHSDMVIDTDNFAFYGNRSNDSRAMRNTLMHEAGHGLGLNHLDSNNSGQLMEPFIQSEFDGPQIDDIRAAHRNYGDALEKNGSNDTQPRATPIGVMNAGDRWSLGTHGSVQVVTRTMTDFISIDGLNDRDFYKFTVSTPVEAQIVITQVGRTYNEGPQDGTQTSLVSSQINPLDLSLYSSSATQGIVLLADADPRTVTRKSILSVNLVPGLDYSLFVRGTVDDIQLYRLDMLFTAITVPEPVTLAMLLTGLAAAAPRRSAA